MDNELIQPEFVNLIFEIRGRKVMIDTDLSMLYEIQTKVLKQQVKRNIDRFPIDFAFELTKIEKDELVANCDRLQNLKFSSINPLAFTEQGVAMLSSVLRSPMAIKINIEIMRTFARYRALLRDNEDLRKEVKQIDEKIDRAFKYLLDRIDDLHEVQTDREPIGFKQQRDKYIESFKRAKDDSEMNELSEMGLDDFTKKIKD